MRSPLLRIATLLLAMLLGAGLAVPSADAQTLSRDASMEAGFLASLNAQRAASGIGPLALSGSMSQAAANWTSQMVQGSFLAHASDIVSGTPAGWTKVGENVGRGQSVNSLTQSFMNSASHARNVLDPAFTTVGIAVIVHPTGRVYTTHRFAAISSSAPTSAPTTAPAPAPAPTTAPAPAPAPAVAAAPTAAESEAAPIGTPPEQLAFVADDQPRLTGEALEKMLAAGEWLMLLNDA